MSGKHRSHAHVKALSRGKAGGHRRKPRREPYKWLGAGAVTFGLGMAIANGAGVAHAEDASSSNTGTSTANSGSDASPSSDPSGTTTGSASASGADSSIRASGTPSQQEEAESAQATHTTDPSATDFRSADQTTPDDDSEPAAGQADSPPTSDGKDNDAVETKRSTESGTSGEQSSLAGGTKKTASANTIAVEARTSVEAVSESRSSEPEAESSTPTTGTQDQPAPGQVEVSTTEIAGLTEPAPDEALDTAPVAAAAFMSIATANALADTSPAPASASDPLGDLLAAIFLGFQRTFFNQSPTANPTQNPGQSSLGVVTGTVGPSDPDGDPLTVTLAQEPSKGGVTVNPDGTYTYTPSAALAATGGTDSFTVTITETNAANHIHGLDGLINAFLHAITFGAIPLNDGSTITKAISVTVVPPNTPTPTYALSVDTGTGVVTGSVNGAPSDMRYYLESNNYRDLVAIDHITGAFTFTPDRTLRENAYLAPGLADTATFTITAYDDRYVLVGSVDITAPIVGLAPPAAPSAVPLALPEEADSAVVAAIPAGEYLFGLGFAVSPDSRRLYSSISFIAGDGDYSGVQVVDTATSTVIAVIPTSRGLGNTDTLVVSPDGRYIYSTGYYYEPDTGNGHNAVKVIDVAAGRITATIGVDADFTALAISPDGNRLYGRYYTTFPDADGQTLMHSALAVIDTQTRMVTNTIVTGPGNAVYIYGSNAASIAMNPNGDEVYIRDVVYDDDGARQALLTVVDTHTNTVIDTITTGDITPYNWYERGRAALAVSPDGSRVYTRDQYNAGDGTYIDAVTVIDTVTRTATAAIPTYDPPGSHYGQGIAVSADGHYLYLSGLSDGHPLKVIDTRTNVLVASVPLGYAEDGLGAVVATPDGSRVYVRRQYVDPDVGAWRFALVVVDGTLIRYPAPPSPPTPAPVDPAPAYPRPAYAASVLASSFPAFEDSLKIEEVVGSDGQHRLVVHITGVVNPLGGNEVVTVAQSWLEAASVRWLATSDEEDYIRQQISAAIANWGLAPDTEVLLVGHSKGGMVAQKIAASGGFNIAGVVTFGAPLLTTGSTDYPSMHFLAVSRDYYQLSAMADIANAAGVVLGLLGPVGRVIGTIGSAAGAVAILNAVDPVAYNLSQVSPNGEDPLESGAFSTQTNPVNYTQRYISMPTDPDCRAMCLHDMSTYIGIAKEFDISAWTDRYYPGGPQEDPYNIEAVLEKFTSSVPPPGQATSLTWAITQYNASITHSAQTPIPQSDTSLN